MKQISIFGASSTLPEDTAYCEAYQLGKLLAAEGYAVITGGYMGTMEAVSRGAFEIGGTVIGITCDEIEKWRSIPPNKWITNEFRVATLKERMHLLIEKCDTAIVLPGGIGTLAEFAFMWAHMNIQAINPRKVIVVGKEWQGLVEHLLNSFSAYIPIQQRQWIQFAADIHSAVNKLIN